MSYDNAEPKVLKTLNSSGQVLNDIGDVISDTTSYWEKKYVEAEPKPDKILKSDGSVVDSNGNQIQAANEYNVKKYNQAEPIPAKYLHSGGTVDENPGGGSADLENNHQTTIDVSTYTEPVEVLPTSGKDGMKKNTVTLTNIPSGGVSRLYNTAVKEISGSEYWNVWSSKQTDELVVGDYVLVPNNWNEGESGWLTTIKKCYISSVDSTTITVEIPQEYDWEPTISTVFDKNYGGVYIDL